MSSKTEICNLAIGHIGYSQPISNVDTEDSTPAKECRRWFEIARKKMFRDNPWPFLRREQALNLVESDPSDEWKYAYRYPTDCLFIRRIVNNIPNPVREQRESYHIVNDNQGKLIYSNCESAKVEFTYNLTSVSQINEDVAVALSYLIAHYIAPKLSKGDLVRIKRELAVLYKTEVRMALNNAFNEQQDFQEAPSSFQQARL